MRTDKRFRLKGVPTICWVEESYVIKTLVEEECRDEDMLKSLFDA